MINIDMLVQTFTDPWHSCVCIHELNNLLEMLVESLLTATIINMCASYSVNLALHPLLITQSVQDEPA